MKIVGKTTRPFRYDLNQTPYDNTVEVTNRFKGLDLIDRVHEELWREVHDIVQEAMIKTIPKKKKSSTLLEYLANRVLPRELTGHSKHPLPTTQEKTIHGHHQMVNTEIRLIIFFAAKDGEAVYSQQKKKDQELTVAQIMNPLFPNSDLN